MRDFVHSSVAERNYQVAIGLWVMWLRDLLCGPAKTVSEYRDIRVREIMRRRMSLGVSRQSRGFCGSLVCVRVCVWCVC
jgi:hypothetical protein